MYNTFPWVGALVSNHRLFLRMFSLNKEQNLRLFAGAKETLNPQTCRGFVDAFLVRQQSLEVRRLWRLSGVLASFLHGQI